MPVVNSVGNTLTGITGTGSFVGSTSPLLVTPRMATINAQGGGLMLSISPYPGAVNSWVINNSTTGIDLFLSATGTDDDVGITLFPKGEAPLTVLSYSTTNQFVINNGSGTGAFNIGITSNDNVYNLPDNCPNGNVVCDISGNNSITTAPPASTASSLSVGSSFQNTLGYDVNITVYLAVSAATSADILLGVGSTSTPTQQTIVAGLTLASLNIIPIQIYIPAQYYALLSTSGTITQSIAGQIQIPV